MDSKDNKNKFAAKMGQLAADVIVACIAACVSAVVIALTIRFIMFLF